ncbi:PLDc N-terminal domain-containing protein [Mycobacterium sp. 141]|uniref:PLDc N-terminal domain-containing protein n=1 Tax=Mycobacterium sp. 141 TaxID=1120797 RepID=UPI00037B31DD|nr:PLDc N-terminal domain-containing protein [Mycobacterium sp. 141]
MWNTFWDFLWSAIIIFAFIAYLVILINILTDLFWRDRTTSGIVKAIWVVFLVLLPYLTALAYLVVRGNGMSSRALEHAAAGQQRADDYIREVAGRSPVREIAEAKNLLEAGAVTPAEFERLKLTALSRERA